jgi:hypothetical protein
MVVWWAQFISQFGSQLLIMAFAAHTYAIQKSAMLTSLVFVIDWCTSILITVFGSHIAESHHPKKLLIKADFISALVTLLFIMVQDSNLFYFALLVLSLRSTIQHLAKAARMKSYYIFFETKERNFFMPLINSSIYISSGLAGILGVVLLKYLSMTSIILIDATTFIFSGILLTLVAPVNAITAPVKAQHKFVKQSIENIKVGIRELVKKELLLDSVFYIILIASFFQGTFSVLIPAIPQTWFHLDSAGTALYFAMFSFGATIGAFLYQFLNQKYNFMGEYERMVTLVFAGIATIFYFLVGHTSQNLLLNVIYFFIMVVSFEIAWLHQLTRMVHHGSQDTIARVFGVQNALGYCFMGALSYGSSVFYDHTGISKSLVFILITLWMAILVWEYFYKIRLTCEE